ncbi:tyrosine-type recombinase/integrase [Microbacterium maritypicum]|uniref:Tyrosine-type recombinase/integrase n=1 Tax=Microbacterium maritypicum TaxID=33918 RepID=A0AAD3X560_MICMQ|nr:tyrosine-type recombinase/integrase [Microbacterium liquefaciens]KAB1886560.1 tyrosine-type recombinase/integrase [Microbacterium liquefaciens]
MRIQIIGRTSSGVPVRWAILGANDELVVEPNRYLAYLENIRRSPNTLRATAYDLRLYTEFLEETKKTLDDVTNEVLAAFARWLRDPSENVTVVDESETVLADSSVNRALSSVAAFYAFLGSLGPGAPGERGFQRLKDTAATVRRPRFTVVDSVGRANKHRTRRVLGPRIRRKKKRTKVLRLDQVLEIVHACRDHRDRLFIMMAFSTGMRMGQILGLKHEDIDTRVATLTVEARNNNPNGARSKRHGTGTIPISEQLARLYIEYMHEQYGYIDSEFVFIDFRTLQPMNARAGHSIVERLRRASGVHDWSLHTLRHSFVTMCQKSGMSPKVISKLVFHASVATTMDIYSHLDVEDLRQVLIESGAWEVESS